LKIKLDENLPDRLVAALTALGHDIDTVYAERLNGQIDPSVWTATQAAHRFFITQDLDFSDIRRYTPGTHAGLVLGNLAATHCSSVWLRCSERRTSKTGADAWGS
jgi:predicted nuclease of predicted toxin-antitoxin system